MLKTAYGTPQAKEATDEDIQDIKLSVEKFLTRHSCSGF
jgi:hypothetical protein